MGSTVHRSRLAELPPDNPLLRMVELDNQHFIRNRLIYDASFIEFVKELSARPNCKTLLDVLESLQLQQQQIELINPDSHQPNPPKEQQKS